MLLWLMLAVCWFGANANPRVRSVNFIIGGAVALILVLFPLVLLTGSRAGLVLCAPTLAAGVWLLYRSRAMQKAVERTQRHARVLRAGVVAVLAIPLLFIFGTLLLAGRQTALSRLFETEAAEELRWTYLPIFLRMLGDFLPLGAGFGAFENAFDMYEPADTIGTRYLNQVHNDAIQVVLEGGIPAGVIVLLALLWLAHRLWRMVRSADSEQRLAAVFLGGSMALWLAASLVDYPLRTPLAAMLVATLTAQLSRLSTCTNSDPGVPDELDKAS
jgi:O-antigen ligase